MCMKSQKPLKLLCIQVMLVIPIFLVAKNSTYLEYIDQYYSIAVSEMNRVGIPASIKLAQGILESNAGRSYLASEANNHFGIKCGNSWDGKKKYREDDDYDHRGNLKKSCFRHYDSAEESYIAHSQFLTDKNKAYRYGFLFELNSDDYKAWAHGLKASGYATNPKYASLLINIIEVYELWKYDLPTYENTHSPIAVKQLKYEINGALIIEAIEGDTPNKIAMDHHVSLNQVLSFNKEITEPGQRLPASYKVYLQSKRKKYHDKKKLHIVSHGERMFDISQNYGIQEQALRGRNRMENYSEPLPGEVIYLRGRRPRRKSLRVQSPEQLQKARRNETEKETLPESKKSPIAIQDDKKEEEYADVKGQHLDFVIVPTGANAPIQVDRSINYHVKIQMQAERADDGGSLKDKELTKLEMDHKGSNSSSDSDTHTSLGKPVGLNDNTTGIQWVTKPKYSVLSGDTLYRIAKLHNMSVDELKMLNNLDSNTISIGQELTVK